MIYTDPRTNGTREWTELEEGGEAEQSADRGGFLFICSALSCITGGGQQEEEEAGNLAGKCSPSWGEVGGEAESEEGRE